MESQREDEITGLLEEIGCSLKKAVLGTGWVIVEPLGGRVEIASLREAEEYYASRQSPKCPGN